MGHYAGYESVLNLDAESQRALQKRGDEVERVCLSILREGGNILTSLCPEQREPFLEGCGPRRQSRILFQQGFLAGLQPFE